MECCPSRGSIEEKEWLQFGPGGYFGEMGLLADRYATANITAAAPPTVYELTKADLKPILEAPRSPKSLAVQWLNGLRRVADSRPPNSTGPSRRGDRALGFPSTYAGCSSSASRTDQLRHRRVPGSKPRRGYDPFGRWSRCREFAFGPNCDVARIGTTLVTVDRGGIIADRLRKTQGSNPLSSTRKSAQIDVISYATG